MSVNGNQDPHGANGAMDNAYGQEGQQRHNPGIFNSQKKPQLNNGLKSIHTKVGKMTTSKKIPRGEEFLSGDMVFDSPRLSNHDLNDVSYTKKNGKMGGTAAKLSANKSYKRGTTFGGKQLNLTDNKSNVMDPNYVKPWSLVSNDPKYSGSVDQSEYPQTPLDSLDYAKRLRFEQLKKTRLEAMCQWKQKDTKGLKKSAYIKEIQKKNSQILKIAEKNDLEKLDVYTDRFPLLILRKSILRVIILIQMTCHYIINTRVFDNISIMVILANSFTMILDDSGTNDNPDPIWAILETVYLVLYTVEMVLKILGMGFFFKEDAYLKDSWNILDFFIVMTSYSTVIQTTEEESTEEVIGQEKEDSKFSAAGLRVFRVLRPLKTISSIKGLRVLMQALLSALPLLRDTLMILLFFFIIFAIAGVQMFNGLLKNRCIAVQTGMVHPDDLFCGGIECPGGYFCGKSSANPNYGVTNFDNLFYCLLAVFQCVTLEGWSDMQRQMQQAFTYFIFLFFVPLVLIGAFFLLNLTLAVINSKFTEAHKKQQEKDLNEFKALHERNLNGDNELENAIKTKDEMSIAQYITARIYAKKMIEFLRMRQEIKRIENERIVKVKAQQKADKQSKRTVMGEKPPPPKAIVLNKNGVISPMSPDKPPSLQKQQSNQSRSNGGSHINGNGLNKTSEQFGNNVILEEEGEQADDGSEQEQLDKEIQEFLLISKVQMQRAGQITNGLNLPKKVDIKQNGNGTNGYKTTQAQEGISGPTMKGNIGPTNKNTFVDPATSQQQKLFSKMAEEFDIDNVIPKIDQKDKASEVNDASSMKSFELSAKNYDINSQNSFNHHGRDYAAQTATANGFSAIPGLGDGHSLNDNESGLITSDSDFEQAAIAAGAIDPADNANQQSARKRYPMNLKKDVSKTFKKMLTSNHNRSLTSDNGKLTNMNPDHTNESTKYGGSIARQEFDNQTSSNLEIESKYKRKTNTKKGMIQKVYKEDNVDANYLEDKFESNEMKPGTKTNKNDIRQLEEFVSTKRPKDQFRDLDPLTQKVEIAQNKSYQGTSQTDVFQIRQQKLEKTMLLEQNKFLQLPERMREKEDPDFAGNGFVRSQFEPYQQKIHYTYKQDSSEIDVESDEEDAMQAQEQPYETAASIGYGQHIKQIQIKEKAKRSDIIISSTLSVSLFPKDQREMEKLYRCEMTREELKEFVDEKNAFNAMLKEHTYQSKKYRVKDKLYRENYSKSFFNRAHFKTNTLRKFKEGVQMLNKNSKPQVKKTKEVEKLEKLKHEQNKRASEKRGLPKFDMEMAKKLLEGKFHEEDEEEMELTNKMQSNIMMLTKEQQLLENQKRLEDFEHQVRSIFAADENAREKPDEIPASLRKEFDLPKQMEFYEVNFHQIRKHDASKKRQTHFWSGQDVIPDKLDAQKSAIVCDQLNSHRVWPLGFKGLKKRARFIVRLHVKSDFYDNLFTFLVLLNTITLSMNQYPLSVEMEKFLEMTNTWFTWAFIYEMFVKILGIGINKYIGDRMNWLDGGIVMISIFELMQPILMPGGTQNLSGLKTIRMLRTFRVFRVVRLLRTLKSMQTIIGVMARSYSSFIYITALMFLFIFIFTLLGMQTFGGIYIDDPEGVPSNNFDSFPVGFITIFQVLTMENWQTVLFVTMRNNNVNKFIISGILIAWIFIGNFILLNLFLAILLDSFLEEDDEELDEDQLAELKRIKKQRAIEKKKRKDANKVFMSTNQIKKQNLPELSRKYFGEEKGQSEEDLEDLDEDQIVQIFKEQGMIKKDKSEIKQQKLFAGVYCEQAFFLFGKDNFIRISCYKMIKHSYWETIVLILICMSSIKLAFDTWEQDEDSAIYTWALRLDLFFNYAFILEMLIKLIALGLCMDEGSYLRDEWNQMDFFIVTSSVFDMALTNLELDAIKILRMLRALRPLRFITHNVAMKLIVKALIESMGGIFNVLIVVAVVFLIFSIMGVNFFAGKFFSCSIDPFILHTQMECEFVGGKWNVFDHHFDNVQRGFITLYIVSSLEGWPDIMLQSINVVGVAQGPVQENALRYMIFFVVFILLGSFFFLNFFIGVLFMKFNAAQREEQKGFTSKDLGWMDIQRLILAATPDYETTNVPKQEWRKQFHNLVSSQRFEGVIMVAIMLNMLQMAVLHEGQSESFSDLLDFTNYIFTAVFIIEACLKLVAFGRSYFNNAWNKFDFFVVVSSILDLLMGAVGESSFDMIAMGPQLARVLRVLRVTRILRLAGKAEGLQAILQTITFSIPALGNVFLLLMLIYFMFSVLGNFLFAGVIQGEVVDGDIKNFTNFLNSFLLLFALSTGEDWNKVMFDCSRTKADGCIENLDCGPGGISFIFFMLLILVCSHVMLNLFILVIIQQFEKYYLPDDNMLARFKNDQVSFMRIWKQLTQDRYQCLKIKENQLTRFFRLLGEENDELGFSVEKYDDGELKKQLLKMAIKSDNGYIYFNEMLYRCMRRRYGNMKINKQMQIYELKTQYNIYLMTLAIQKKGKAHLNNESVFNNIIKKENGVNPFLTVMNFKISFKTWLKHSKAKARIEQAQKLGQEINFDEDDSFFTKKAKTVIVDIEVEYEDIYTSEEEFDDNGSLIDGEARNKSSGAHSNGSGSNLGSSRDLHSFRDKKKSKDHLAYFQKKMSHKLQERMIQVGSKSANFPSTTPNKGSQNLLSPPAEDAGSSGPKKEKKRKLQNRKSLLIQLN